MKENKVEANYSESIDEVLTTKSKPKKSERKRHGARNQHKMKHFVKWLRETFNDETLEHVIDVAGGGKGELASRLAYCENKRVTVIDPRPIGCDARGRIDEETYELCVSVANVVDSTIIPKLPKKWQQKYRLNLEADERFVCKRMDELVSQIVASFDSSALLLAGQQHDHYVPAKFHKHSNQQVVHILEEGTLLVGMHADSATEAIVDVALAYQMPFVIVPCCVFPNLFQERFLCSDNNTVRVRTHSQFIEYLMKKGEQSNALFHKEILPFEGRNVAIWWDGNKTMTATTKDSTVGTM